MTRGREYADGIAAPAIALSVEDTVKLGEVMDRLGAAIGGCDQESYTSIVVESGLVTLSVMGAGLARLITAYKGMRDGRKRQYPETMVTYSAVASDARGVSSGLHLPHVEAKSHSRSIEVVSWVEQLVQEVSAKSRGGNMPLTSV